MPYRVTLDRGLDVGGKHYPHGAVVEVAAPDTDALLKAGHIEEVKTEAAKPATKAASKPAAKEG